LVEEKFFFKPASRGKVSLEGLMCSLWYWRDKTMPTYQDIDLIGASQRRRIPVRLWLPDGSTRAWLLFSVGFGGDRTGYAYLGRAWAARGVATAVVEHIGSNLEVLKGLPGKTREERNQAVVRAVGDPAELAARPLDLLETHRHLAPRFGALPWGLGGHSFGSYTVLAALGLPTIPVLPRLPDPLLGASSCLVISPQAPGHLFSQRVLGTLNLPTLVLTGSKDDPLDGEGDYRRRVAVYEHLPVDQRNLVVLEGAEHMAFAGIGLSLAATLRAVEGLTSQWWESTLFAVDTPPPERARQMAAEGGEVVRGDYR
jgi:predicted dienelactone hydrolase